MAGKVLAIKLGEWQELGNGVINTGFRVMLSVQSIVMEVQTTTFFGYNLFQMTYSPWGVGQVDVGSLSATSLYNNFLAPFKGRKLEWAQFEVAPYNAAFYLARSYNTVPPEIEPPESRGIMIYEDSGYDAVRGWWIRFKGNFRIAIPIFQNFPLSAVKNMTPDYGIKIS